MVDRHRLIGNDIKSGGAKIRPYRPNHDRLRTQSQAMQLQRQRMIDYAASPPAIPLPKPIREKVPDTPSFNQFAYSLLLIAIMAAIAIATPLINWMFLVYGLFAIIVRIPSHLIFISGLLCLSTVVLAITLSRNSLANTFAIMGFYFMLIGIVRSMLGMKIARLE